MNTDRLNLLKSRAEKATAIALKIEKLQLADPHKFGISVRLRNNRDGEIIDDNLLKRVIATGRLAVMAEFESELESLLSEPPAVDAADVEVHTP